MIDVDVFKLHLGERPSYYDQIFPPRSEKTKTINMFIDNDMLETYACAVFPDKETNTDITGMRQTFQRTRLTKFIYACKDAYNHSRFTTELPPGSEIYHLVAKINEQPYGSIFLYRNSIIDSNIMRMQFIFRLSVPTFFAILNPKLQLELPRLNSILIPKILEIAKSLGVTEIQATPIDKQTEILRKHYGFVDNPKPLIAPCNLLPLKKDRISLVKYLGKNLSEG